MPYTKISELPESVKGVLPVEAQRTFLKIFNAAYEQYKDDGKASAVAWAGLKNAGWRKTKGGKWEKVEKSTHSDQEGESFSVVAPITKIIPEKRQVFGWAMISHEWKQDPVTKAYSLEQVVDYQNDLIDEEELEKMAYKFTKLYGDGGEMHLKSGSATCIESMVFTVEKQKVLKIPEGIVPVGWWVGFEVHDEDAWERVKDGTYRAFSIEGTSKRVPV